MLARRSVRVSAPTFQRTYRCDPCSARLSVRVPNLEEAEELHVIFRSHHDGHGKGSRPKVTTAQQRRASKRDEADALWRQVILTRDKGTCRRCGSAESVQAAHVVSRRYLATRWWPENGIALCLRCHKWQTEHPLEGEMFFEDLLGSGLFARLRFDAWADANNRGHPDWPLLLASLRQDLARLETS